MTAGEKVGQHAYRRSDVGDIDPERDATLRGRPEGLSGDHIRALRGADRARPCEAVGAAVVSGQHKLTRQQTATVPAVGATTCVPASTASATVGAIPSSQDGC